MLNIISTFFIFLFLELVIYTSLIYNQNLHINSVLENTLASDYKEFKVIKEFFSEDIDKKIYNKFRKIILLNSVKDIHNYLEYEKRLLTLSSIFTDEEQLYYLKKTEVFNAIKYAQKDILLFERDKK